MSVLYISKYGSTIIIYKLWGSKNLYTPIFLNAKLTKILWRLKKLY
jgi:hypothetical protein